MYITKIMKVENEMTIVGFLCGFAIGVCVMMLIYTDKEARLIEKYDLELENINEEIYKYEGLYEYTN